MVPMVAHASNRITGRGPSHKAEKFILNKVGVVSRGEGCGLAFHVCTLPVDRENQQPSDLDIFDRGSRYGLFRSNFPACRNCRAECCERSCVAERA
jgi:hypothetical protein